MKITKKFLSVVLAVLVIVSTLAVGAISASAATLKAPTKLTVTNMYHSFVLKWGKVAGAKSYEVYKNGKQMLVTSTNSCRDYSLVGGQTYSYKVRALNGSKKGAFSSVVKCARVNITVITGLENTKKGVKVSWVKRTAADYYMVERKTTSGFTRIKKTKALSYVDTTAVAGTTYTYRVMCYNSATKAYSADPVVEKITYLAPVTGFTAIKGVDSRTINLKWAASTGAESYNVYRQKCTDEDFVKVANVTATAFVDTDIIANPSAYCYYVTAVKGNYESDKSVERWTQTYGSTPAYFDDQRNYHIPLTFKAGDVYAEGKALSEYYSFGGNYDVTILEGGDVISIDNDVITAKKAGTAKVKIKVTDAVKAIVDNQIQDELVITLTNRDIILEITVA